MFDRAKSATPHPVKINGARRMGINGFIFIIEDSTESKFEIK
jgi:hypothetical protein